MQIFSSTYFPERTASPLFYNQILFYIASFVIMLITATLSYKLINWRTLQAIVFVLTFVTLIGVLLIGEEVFGAKRWISLGSVAIQPSEFAKLALVFHTAFLLSLRPIIDKTKIRKRIQTGMAQKIQKIISPKVKIYISIAAIWLIYAILVLQQKSMGNTLMLTGILLIMLIYRIPRNKYIFSGIVTFVFSIGLSFFVDQLTSVVLIGILAFLFLIIGLSSKLLKISVFFLAGVFLIGISIKPGLELAYDNVLQPYQKVRIESFLNPEEDQAASWNRQQAEIALGSGRFFGKGFLQGTHTNYQYLPFSYTDFAFASIGEQFGFVGILSVAILYLILLNKIISLARRVNDPLAELLCIGISAMIFLNMFQHMGMNVGILPITGVPLPFISYGGSALLATSLGIGILLSISADMDNKKANVVKHKLERKVIN
jgi:rod shape determining protein RodA